MALRILVGLAFDAETAKAVARELASRVVDDTIVLATQDVAEAFPDVDIVVGSAAWAAGRITQVEGVSSLVVVFDDRERQATMRAFEGLDVWFVPVLGAEPTSRPAPWAPAPMSRPTEDEPETEPEAEAPATPWSRALSRRLPWWWIALMALAIIGMAWGGWELARHWWPAKAPAVTAKALPAPVRPVPAEPKPALPAPVPTPVPMTPPQTAPVAPATPVTPAAPVAAPFRYNVAYRLIDAQRVIERDAAGDIAFCQMTLAESSGATLVKRVALFNPIMGSRKALVADPRLYVGYIVFRRSPPYPQGWVEWAELNVGVGALPCR